jgi:hypothetical protein
MRHATKDSPPYFTRRFPDRSLQPRVTMPTSSPLSPSHTLPSSNAQQLALLLNGPQQQKGWKNLQKEKKQDGDDEAAVADIVFRG